MFQHSHYGRKRTICGEKSKARDTDYHRIPLHKSAEADKRRLEQAMQDDEVRQGYSRRLFDSRIQW